ALRRAALLLLRPRRRRAAVALPVVGYAATVVAARAADGRPGRCALPPDGPAREHRRRERGLARGQDLSHRLPARPREHLDHGQPAGTAGARLLPTVRRRRMGGRRWTRPAGP